MESLIAWETKPSSSSLMVAAFRSVSSVMCVFLIHSAVADLAERRFSSALTRSTKARASAGVPFSAGLEVEAPFPAVHDRRKAQRTMDRGVFMSRTVEERPSGATDNSEKQ